MTLAIHTLPLGIIRAHTPAAEHDPVRRRSRLDKPLIVSATTDGDANDVMASVGDRAVVELAAKISCDAGIAMRPQTREEIRALRAHGDLIRPGLVAPHRWRPGSRGGQRCAAAGWARSGQADTCCLAGVGVLR